MKSAEDEVEFFIIEPWDGRVLLWDGRCDEVGVVRAFLEVYVDVLCVDGYASRGIDEVIEECPRVDAFVALCDVARHEAIEAAGHEGELEVAVDLHGDGGGECIHVEEIDAVGDLVFDDHTLGVTCNERGCGEFEMVGDQECRIFVSEIGNGELAQGAGVAG